MMSTVPSCRPWLMSVSLPSDEAGNTWMSMRPCVRCLICSLAQTAEVWNGSDVSYTCAHLSLRPPLLHDSAVRQSALANAHSQTRRARAREASARPTPVTAGDIGANGRAHQARRRRLSRGRRFLVPWVAHLASLSELARCA